MYTWKKRLLAAILAGCLSVGLMTPALAVEGEATQPTTAPEVTESVAPTDEVDPGFSVDPTTQPTETPAETPSAQPTETPAETPSSEPTETPAETPSSEPTETPAETPSTEPTETPAETPSTEPTAEPTESPEVTEIPEETVPGGALPEEEFDVAAAYEYLMSLKDNAAIEAYVMTLTEEQLENLKAYFLEKEQERDAFFETVVVTDAGPFMPPVEVEPFVEPKLAVAPMQRAMMAVPFNLDTSNAANGVEPLDANPDNGLELSKKVTSDGNGNYTITMEAYTTGTTTTSTNTVPVDIILVLDQSGSMASNFEGKDHEWVWNGIIPEWKPIPYEDSRQYALKAAAQDFIIDVSEEYSDKSDHRIAIVTFNGSAQILQPWTTVDVAGTQTLYDEIGGLDKKPSGATNVGAGMEQAETLMGEQYDYQGTNKTRQQVVVVFTDGVPTEGSEFDTAVANTAISSGKRLKDKGATIYSIGIFNGANPDELYGASGFDTNSDGTVGSVWLSDDWGLFPGLDFPSADRPAGNRFLNYLSSNYKTATSIGLVREDDGTGILNKKVWHTITENFDRTAAPDQQYYLTAYNLGDLKKVFETISSNIGTPTIKLDGTTEIRDVMTDYFTVPAQGDVRVYEVASTGNMAFNDKDRVDITDNGTVTVDVNGKTISVTGFDFNENYVTAEGRGTGNAKFYGKKLVIEFTVKAKDGFWGGNAVPTNEGTSGIYTKDNTLVEAFEVPTVDVPVTVPAMTGKDVNIYGGNTAPTAEELVDHANIPTDWRTKYVNITYRESNENAISNLIDGGYSITVTATAKEGDPSNQDSEIASSNVYVYMPTLTFQDSQLASGTAVNYDMQNYLSVQWLHDGIEADSSTMDRAPDLTLTYNPAGGELGVGNHEVNVEVANNLVDLTQYVTFVRKACNVDGCGNQTDSTHVGATDDPEFVVHIYLPEFSFTLTKELNAAADGDQSFIFKITKESESEPYMVVALVIPEGQTEAFKTITLPSGTYTIEEDQSWSWKYDVVGNDKQTVSEEGAIITFTNTKDPDTHWLGGSDSVENVFATTGVTVAMLLSDVNPAAQATYPRSTDESTSGNDDDKKNKDENTEPDPSEPMETQEGGVSNV